MFLSRAIACVSIVGLSLLAQSSDSKLRAIRPQLASAPGHKDPEAVALLNTFSSLVGLAPQWKGDGVASVANGDGTFTEHACHIEISGTTRFRFDVDSGIDSTSLRLNPDSQSIKRGLVDPESLPPVSRLLGPFPFARFLQVWDSVNGSLTDYGSVSTVDGQLHRIGLDQPLLGNIKDTSKSAPPVSADLYLSKDSLLRKVVYQLSPTDPSSPLVEESFNEYKTFDGSSLPTHFTESVDQQVLWSVAITQWSRPANVDDNRFKF